MTLNPDGSLTVTFVGDRLRILEDFKVLSGSTNIGDSLHFALSILEESQLKTIKIIDESTGEFKSIYPWKFNKPQWVIDKEASNGN